MKYTNIKTTDKEVFDLLEKEEKRQVEGIELIPSENYASEAVIEAVGSIMTNKYSEGYPGKRYYAGNVNADEIETLAIERAKKLFNVPHANVQPYSGSPANFAVYFALLKPGDIVLGHSLTEGGHLTHGWSVSVTGSYYESHQYGVKENGEIDYEELEVLANKYHPNLIWCGATAYVKHFDYERVGRIADSVGAYFAADIAHISGLIVGGVHPTPVPYAHIVTTTTHKTLRGPRGGMVLVTEKGLQKDPDLAKKIDRAIFPGLQGGPHDHVTAAIAVALHEASTDDFKEYAAQIVKNAKALAKRLIEHGFTLVGNGTENHLILMDLRSSDINGWYFENAMDACHMTANKNTVPNETNTPFFPSGIRMGTPAITTRGMNEKDMETIANFIARVRDALKKYEYIHETLTKTDGELRKQFKKDLKEDKDIKTIAEEVKEFASKFPVPGIKA